MNNSSFSKVSFTKNAFLIFSAAAVPGLLLAPQTMRAGGAGMLSAIIAAFVACLPAVICLLALKSAATDSDDISSAVSRCAGAGYGEFFKWFMAVAYYPAMTATFAFTAAKYAAAVFGADGNGTMIASLSFLFLIFTFLLRHIAGHGCEKGRIAAAVAILLPPAVLACAGIIYGVTSGAYGSQELFSVSAGDTSSAFCASLLIFAGWPLLLSSGKGKSGKSIAAAVTVVVFAVVCISGYYGSGAADAADELENIFGSVFGRIYAALVFISAFGALSATVGAILSSVDKSSVCSKEGESASALNKSETDLKESDSTVNKFGTDLKKSEIALPSVNLPAANKCSVNETKTEKGSSALLLAMSSVWLLLLLILSSAPMSAVSFDVTVIPYAAIFIFLIPPVLLAALKPHGCGAAGIAIRTSALVLSLVVLGSSVYTNGYMAYTRGQDNKKEEILSNVTVTSDGDEFFYTANSGADTMISYMEKSLSLLMPESAALIRITVNGEQFQSSDRAFLINVNESGDFTYISKSGGEIRISGAGTEGEITVTAYNLISSPYFSMPLLTCTVFMAALAAGALAISRICGLMRRKEEQNGTN